MIYRECDPATDSIPLSVLMVALASPTSVRVDLKDRQITVYGAGGNTEADRVLYRAESPELPRDYPA